MLRSVFLFNIFIFFLAGCSLFQDMSLVEIESFSPSNRHVNDPEVTVRIRFSQEMNRKSLMSAFSFREDGEMIEGVMKWSDNDKVLKFYPKKSCLPGKRYIISIDTQAESKNGNDLKETFNHEFLMGDDEILPFVLRDECFPVPDTILPYDNLREQIVIQFSEPMDKRYAYNNLNINPSVQGIYRWVNDTDEEVDIFSDEPSSRLIFIPGVDYQLQRYYTVTVSSSFTDEAGNGLLSDYVFKFYVGDYNIKPEIVRVETSVSNLEITYGEPVVIINEDIEKDDVISLEFSNRMDRNSVESSISVVPSTKLDFKWISDFVVELHFPDRLKWQETYQLKVRDSAKEIEQNKLLKNYDYYFLVNGIDSYPPSLSRVRYKRIEAVIGSYVTIDDSTTTFGQHIVDVSLWADNQRLSFIFDFDARFELNLQSLFSSINFSGIGLSTTQFVKKSFKKLNITDDAYDMNYISYEFVIEADGFSQGAIDVDDIIILESSNVLDIMNNQMITPFSVYLIFSK